MTENTSNPPVQQTLAPTFAPSAELIPNSQGVPMAYGTPPYAPVVGKIRSTGVCILLAVVTFGIYTLVWFYKTHDEMKRHTGHGLGGGLAFILAWFVGIVMPYITSSEVGTLYERAGHAQARLGCDGPVVLPRNLHPDRSDRLVRQDQRRPQRVLAGPGSALML